MAAVVVRSDGIADVGAVGLRRSGTSARVTTSDRFHVGSNTKAMTATAIAVLVEEGTLSWGTTPLDAFPGSTDTIDPAFHDITLDQLLAHRAGLPPFTDGAAYAELPDFGGTPKEKRAAFARYVLEGEPAYTPGSEFVYSNAGYTIAAAMAEQMSGVSWERMMRLRLFQPLGIRAGFGWPAADDPNQPWGHWEQGGDTLQPHGPDGAYRLGEIVAPAGDVHMSITEYARFLQLHLRGLRGEDTELLDPAAIENLHTSRGAIIDSAGAAGYALGWGVQQMRGARTSWHLGSAGTFKARAFIQPARDLAIGVFANAGNEEAEHATAEVRDRLLEQYVP